MTLYDGDLPPRVAAQLERRSHAPGAVRDPWRDPETQAELAVEAIDEEMAALAEQISYVRSGRMSRDLEGEWERLRQRRDRISPPSVPDPRLCGSMGSDERSEWRGGAA